MPQYQGYEYDNFANLHIQSDYDVNQTTTYGYDALHRVTSSAVDHNGQTYRADYGYDALGNFKYKSDYASNYQYETGSNRIDQVQRLDGTWQGFSYDGNGNLLTNDEGSLTNTYNTAMKPVQVIRYGNRLNFSYDANEFRYKQVKTANGNTSTIYYVDKDYELEIDDAGKETYTYYVGGHTIVKTTDAKDDVSHLSTNRLGSVSLITNGNAKVSTSLPGLSIREHRGYDVFGRMYALDNPQAITLGSEFTSRGFTAHEHLQSVQLIHMNGRAYDYNLGRFLSVDPFIQNPTNTQSINPYSYIMNNPLAGTDPTGYNSECQNEDAEVCADGDGTKGKTKIDDDTEKAATENGGKILVIVEKAKKRVKDRRSANKTGSIEDGYIIHGVIGEQSGGDGGTSENQSDAKGALNGVTAYVGQQLGDAGAARDDYNKRVAPLDPNDSEERSKIKQETRDKTPKLVNDFIKKNRPSTGAQPGTGGRANSTNPKANKLASMLKHGGRGLIVVNLGMNAVDIATSENTGLALMRSALGVVGGIGGGIVGAIGGSFVAPGPGTAIGGVSGAALGGAGGERLGEAIHNFFWGRREDSTSN